MKENNYKPGITEKWSISSPIKTKRHKKRATQIETQTMVICGINCPFNIWIRLNR